MCQNVGTMMLDIVNFKMSVGNHTLPVSARMEIVIENVLKDIPKNVNFKKNVNS